MVPLKKRYLKKAKQKSKTEHSNAIIQEVFASERKLCSIPAVRIIIIRFYDNCVCILSVNSE